MQMTPFWTDQTRIPPDLHPIELPGAADVVIVGSGVTGLNAALELAKAGISVVVLEQEQIGWGASSRNAGMMSAGVPASTSSQLKKYGPDFGQWFFPIA